MHTLAGDAELAGDLGLVDAGGKQLGGTQPTRLEPLALVLCRRAAGDGWHGLILTGRSGQHQTHVLSDQHPEPVR
jgi:hypothetical protein